MLVNLYAPLEVWDLRARAIYIFCPQVTMVVLFHDWLDQYSWLGSVYLSYLHEVATAHSAHYIGRVDWVCLLLEMFLPANNVILEELLVFIVYFVLVMALRLCTLDILHIDLVPPDGWRPGQLLVHVGLHRSVGSCLII